tara:strand:+ start:1599 stop:2078 length:480 start_codon:yes stop_codon:yes gene_type:complete
MATYKHGSGAVTAAKRVVVKDAFVQGSEVVIEVDQPAGTILNDVICRFIGNVGLGGSGDIGFEIGTSSSGNQIAKNVDGFLDAGTAIAANSVYFLLRGNSGANSVTADAADTTNDHTSGAAAGGYTDSDRTIFFTTICANETVSGDNEIELNFVFTHLN